MSYFSFPVDPVAFSIGPLVVRWYALAYLSGFLLGWRYALHFVKRIPRLGLGTENVDDFLSWAVVGVILGGRLGYVLLYNLDYYLQEPLEILKIWHGGMSFHGGIIGVITALYIYTRKHELNLLSMADVLSVSAPIGLFFGRLANFINAELYGRVTTLPWGIVFPGAGDAPRHPSQLYQAFLEGIILFLVLHFVSRSASYRPGVLSALFLILYGLMRGLIEFVRAPDPQIGLIGGLFTMGQILCIPMVIIGCALIYGVTINKEKNNTLTHNSGE
ncbi:MAG: prolipoprotein diacylglyceryl transferase [Alphaproteobacteria bacterium]